VESDVVRNGVSPQSAWAKSHRCCCRRRSAARKPPDSTQRGAGRTVSRAAAEARRRSPFPLWGGC
jgi:hypothetical protein